MSTVRANAVLDSSGGNTATINGMTPTAASLQGFRNRIINGDMRIDQRNNGASLAFAAGAGGAYTLDRFSAFRNTTGSFAVQRSATAPTGYNNSLLVTVTAADSSVGTTDVVDISQAIEGFNIADLGWGSASAQTVTISFWVRSSVTGTFCCAIRNAATTRAYVREYTITVANTFQQITLTFPGETSGAWSSDNSTGMSVNWTLMAGSTFQTTPNTWTTGNVFATSNQANLLGTNGATFYITGVQLEAGSVATPFERRDYGRELIMCQRYYQKSYNVTTAPGTVTNDGYFLSFAHNPWTLQQTCLRFPVFMRANPTVTLFSAGNGASGVIFDATVGVNRSCGVVNAGNSGAEINGSGNLITGNYFTFHFVANSEL